MPSDTLTFLFPWLLGFLAVLPVIWLLLRVTPPKPQSIIFPALALLRNLVTPQQTPAHTPWWLLALRLLIAAILIVAFAQPVFDPDASLAGNGTTLIVIDNDWASARDWDTRQQAMHELIHQAEHENRNIVLLPTTPPPTGEPLEALGPMPARAAYAEAERLEPEPWPSDWVQAKQLFLALPPAAVPTRYWLASGLGNVDAKIFYEALRQGGTLHVLNDPKTPIYLLTPPQMSGTDRVRGAPESTNSENFTLTALRAQTDDEASINIVVMAQDGRTLAHLPLHFSPGSPSASAPLNLPLDVHNQIARFEIEGRHSTADMIMLGLRWQHLPIGLVGDKAELEQHSLVSNLFYLERALKPYTDIHVGSLTELMKQNISIVFMTDNTELHEDQIAPLITWIQHGGVLVRFAGEKLALTQKAGDADLLPVSLRTGDRAMGGTLSWTTPQKLQDFPKHSPFAGLKIPDDVSVKRQVLAEPAPDLGERTWAALTDGTPLVTGKAISEGYTVLFHVPARSDWSNLPISGLFVDMLRRMVDLSRDAINESNVSSTEPLRMLNAFGALRKPDAAVLPLMDTDLSHIQIGPKHPPGLYGTEMLNRYFNLGRAIGQPEALRDIPTEDYKRNRSEIELEPYLLSAAFALLLVDFIISLFLRGILTIPRRTFFLPLILFMIWAGASSAHAATDEKMAIKLTDKTYLAYVQTGSRETDHISESGLLGLARILQRRTSIDQIDVIGVNPDTDDLAFFPLLYWPIVPGEAPLTPDGTQHVNEYLHHGGMILFDSTTGEAPAPTLLTKLLPNVDIPPLVVLPQHHVLKRTFYLLDEFPGRYDNNEFWLEPEEMSSYDGVATVLAGNNDWAAAWAIDNNGQPLFPCTPGGEAQRERAYRFGVNLVMYALTGNYKADQLQEAPKK